ncbi:MAG: hypothetical protein JWM77_869, partial [Rhodospirillales bacterium]|nr:hypothetical protein [Rhodospirillales bacterium]
MSSVVETPAEEPVIIMSRIFDA